ncbi:dTDP-4-dehydrorhamnose reductase [Prochlorococcus marinus str. MIT 1320]|nr:dTDP-4-dehydrorhamnose reductase [Prochlorococcus marinus str. MIT 1320]
MLLLLIQSRRWLLFNIVALKQLNHLRILLIGTSGQLGRALLDSAPADLEVIPCNRNDLDLVDVDLCKAFVEFHRPEWVVNAAAFTAVDAAEKDPHLAHVVNCASPAAFAAELAKNGGRMLQISTDFVFNGQQGHPYQPDDSVEPLGAYGISKAAGEFQVQNILGDRAHVLRTSWLYGPVGSNFLLTMLRLHQLKAAAGESLAVVADQVGCPTSTLGLAAACWRLIQRASQIQGSGIQEQRLPPILHWSDAGAASWYDFALAIGELGVAAGLLQQAAYVKPITTADYPTPARRPSYSLLDCSGSSAALEIEQQHWREALKAVIAVLASA